MDSRFQQYFKSSLKLSINVVGLPFPRLSRMAPHKQHFIVSFIKRMHLKKSSPSGFGRVNQKVLDGLNVKRVKHAVDEKQLASKMSLETM